MSHPIPYSPMMCVTNKEPHKDVPASQGTSISRTANMAGNLFYNKDPYIK